MWTTRRQFIARSAVGGAGLAAMPLLSAGPAGAAATDRWIVASFSRFQCFSSTGEPSASTAWALIDLGESRRIHAVRLRSSGQGSPALVAVTCSDDPAFATGHPVALWPEDDAKTLARFRASPAVARYLRVDVEMTGRDAPATSMIGGLEILSDGRSLSVALREMTDVHCPFPCRSAGGIGASGMGDLFA